MDSADNNRIAAALNQSTPYAPRNPQEAAERLASASEASGDEIPKARDGTDKGEPKTASPEISRVFVPTVSETDPNELPVYQLRRLADGTAGLAVYTTLEILKKNLGPDQSWSEASLLELLFIVGRERIGVALNPHIDETPLETQDAESMP